MNSIDIDINSLVWLTCLNEQGQYFRTSVLVSNGSLREKRLENLVRCGFLHRTSYSYKQSKYTLTDAGLAFLKRNKKVHSYFDVHPISIALKSLFLSLRCA